MNEGESRRWGDKRLNEGLGFWSAAISRLPGRRETGESVSPLPPRQYIRSSYNGGAAKRKAVGVQRSVRDGGGFVVSREENHTV
ncbi:hypothetical protein COCNU_04G009280 [Cocos nucifera]|uniref:Uncharacterized protein n=1 Tax=Cocos nucifera TaxID=13894 RepID=A0A8K0I6K9_COCNU|nr:hypothetical protein COCNU_04G009280 [Cocos nucifera]